MKNKMQREYSSPVRMACCCRGEHSSRSEDRYTSQRNSCSDRVAEYGRNYSSRNLNEYYGNQIQDDHCRINLDENSWDTLSYLRQKLCREQASMARDSSPRQNMYQTCGCSEYNKFSDSPVLRKANDLLDYAPESEFLKKIKQQCQLLHERKPNLFSTIDKFEKVPYDCKKYSDLSSSKSEERIYSNRNRSDSPLDRLCPCHTSNQQLKRNGLENRQTQERSSEKYFRCQRDNSPKLDNKETTLTEKKSEHVSRSRIPTKCRGRRRRKSQSSEKCSEDEDRFEATLKKPHENSCERCWRFASPSRSPVNKPDQRYDPNFRRGHSNTDFEKGDGDLTMSKMSLINDNKKLETGMFMKGGIKEKKPQVPSTTIRQKQQGGTTFFSSPSPSVRISDTPVVHCLPKCDPAPPNTSFYQPDSWYRKPVRKSVSKDFKIDNSMSNKAKEGNAFSPEYCRREFQKVMTSNENYKPRPKSYTPGVTDPSSRYESGIECAVIRPCSAMNDCNNYKESTPRLKKHSFDLSDCSNRSLETPDNPVHPILAETCMPRPKSACVSSETPKINLPPIFETEKPEKIKSICSKSNSPVVKGRKRSKEKTAAKEPVKHLVKETKSSSSPKKSSSRSLKKCKPQTSSPKQNKLNSLKPGSETLKSPCGTQSRLKTPVKASVKAKTPPKTKTPPKSLKSPSYSKSYKEQIAQKPEEPPIVKGPDYEDLVWDACEQMTPHVFKQCRCPVPSPSQPPVVEPRRTNYCCHCDWDKEQKIQSEPIPRRLSSNANDLINRVPCYCKPQPSCRSASQDFDNLLEKQERNLQSPYRNRRNEYNSEARCDNNWNNNRDIQCNHKDSNEDLYYDCRADSPRKYFVYYMTQSRGKKGGDMEVLVEEVAQTNSKLKDTRTKDITEKMKKILECPRDSMALRFQKGVSETCKTPRSSRILYF